MGQPHTRDAQWFWSTGDQKQGPVRLADLQRMMRAGQLGPQTMVWTDAMAEWTPAWRLPALSAPPAASDDGLGLLVPSGPQSALSIAAGYCGLIGVLFPLAAPAGVALGILGVRDLKQHDHKRGWGRAITGIALGGLVTLAWLIVLIVALLHRP
jgi:hypothetical protein